MKVITTVQCDRPEYTKRMLDSLAACDGIEQYMLLAYIEPKSEEVIRLVRNFDACHRALRINHCIYGCNQNTKQALIEGAIFGDYVLHIEDDVILAKDALTVYENWQRRENSYDAFSFNLYNKISPESYNDGLHNTIYNRDTFIPWGFALKRESIQMAVDNDCFSVASPYLSWDCRVDQMCKKNGLYHSYPFLSRANNIGAIGGVHVPSAAWHKENQYLEFWKGSLDESKNNQ